MQGWRRIDALKRGVSTYAIRIEDEDGTRNVYFSAAEVLAALEEYAEASGDAEYARVAVWEMRGLGSSARRVALTELLSR